MIETKIQTGDWTRFTLIDRWAIGIAMAWFLMFGTMSAFVTHAFTFFPDSRQHYQYVKVLLAGHLPKLENTKISQEQHQPPFYYLSAAPWAKLGLMVATDGGVLFVRLWTLLLASGVIILTALLARQLFPSATYIPAMAAVIVGFNPQFFVMSAEVNNDGLASLLGTAAILLMVRLLLGWVQTTGRDWLIGTIALLAFLTKMSLWPLVILLLLIGSFQREWRWSSLWRLLLPTVVFGGAWVLRNIVVYGDPTVLNKLKQYFGDEQHRDFLTPEGIRTWFTIFFESYWTRYRHFVVGLHQRTYQLIKLSFAVSVMGIGVFLFREWKHLARERQLAFLAVLASLLVVAVGVFTYSLDFYQPQGRYLFPAQSAIALFIALGLDSLMPKRYKGFMAVALVLGLIFMNAESLHQLVASG